MNFETMGIGADDIQGAGTDTAGRAKNGELQFRSLAICGTTADSKTLAGAGEICFRGLYLRLVSLWWELPPRLDSNNRILKSE